MLELILASQSPRRKQILEEAGYKFRIFPTEISEILNKNLSLEDQVSDCAHQKAQAAAERLKPLESEHFLVLAADTLVVHGAQAIGKPKNKEEAILILNQLSGQVHRVITGFCLFDLKSKNLVLGHESTKIQFRSLSQNEIVDYVDSGDPMDKAGAYGIQGEARKFVANIEGSFENVVGLPLKAIEKIFNEQNWHVAKKY